MKKIKLLPLILIVLLISVITIGCSSNQATNATPAKSQPTTESPAKNEPQTSNQPPAKISYKDGTYEGSSDAGIHPGLRISVVVKDGKITEVNVIEHKETEGIGSVALEKLPPLIVKAQSTDVDAVTGASLSSKALKEAVNKALAQAKK